MRWDLTKNLHMNFQSATHAQIEEPYTPCEQGSLCRPVSCLEGFRMDQHPHTGVHRSTTVRISQASYKVPLNLLPVFDWVNSDASYNANYSWERGTEDEEGNSYGNTINTQRELTLNGNFNLVKLYNHVPFLKKVNDKFDRTQSRAQMQRKKQEKKKKKQEAKEQAARSEEGAA